jgi:hypothetical protein
MIPLPQNLPLLIGVKGPQAEALEKILKGCSLSETLAALGKFWKIKVWFSQDVEIRVFPRVIKREEEEDGSILRTWRSNYKKSNVHLLNKIALGYDGSLIYCLTKNARQGFHLPRLDLITQYEPVIKTDEFRDYDHFASKFDRRFINESEILKLWNSHSAQHGGKYKPSDFHKYGPQGKKVLKDFLRLFMDVNTEGKCYVANGTQTGSKTLSQRYNTNHHTGRDISIAHTLGQEWVRYISVSFRIHGSYGLVANMNEFLPLEND